jgi:hypothetical protein
MINEFGNKVKLKNQFCHYLFSYFPLFFTGISLKKGEKPELTLCIPIRKDLTFNDRMQTGVIVFPAKDNLPAV